ncbi:hypothetical protein HYFRA_00011396 [Hymenoscyphus fraxineus]|uniref:Uncharacterized protein n=1 Tax=Hymenoscyphus fraxineus TaxID=746836 RepID=A0A9N9KZN9_9HELO|nr:hypothetical protein HYFRA_00011396 [Hymenoscyphus fraxineus]
MQLTNLFFTFLLATAVAAKGKNGTHTHEGGDGHKDGHKHGGDKAITDKSLCREMAQLSHLVKVASNETKIAEMTKNNATKIAQFKTKAAEATTKLTTMQSNATFMNVCNVIGAEQSLKAECKKMRSLQKLKTLAGNETAITAMTKGNATKAASLKAKAAEASTNLDKMMANATLVEACKSQADAKNQKSGATPGASPAGAQAAAAASGSPTPTPSAAAAAANSAGLVLMANTGFISTAIVVAAGILML